MPSWDNQAAQGVFGQDPEISGIQIHHDVKQPKVMTTWSVLEEPNSQSQELQQQQQQKMSSTPGFGNGSLADYYDDLTKAIDAFTFEIPESPPSSASDSDDSSFSSSSSSADSDRNSSPSLSLPELSPDRSFTLLTLDTPVSDTTPPINAGVRPWEQYLPKTTPPHLRAFRLNGRRPRSTRPGRLQLRQDVQPLKLFTPEAKAEPQLLEAVETETSSTTTTTTTGGLNIFDNEANLNDTSFLLPSPLSPCEPANFPRAPQNSPDEAYFHVSFPFPSSAATSAPIPIPGGTGTSNTNTSHFLKADSEETEPLPMMVEIETKTCRRTPYYPPNSSQTEDRSRVYMNRGPHYIANWTPLSSLPVEAQRRVERSMVKFTAPEGPGHRG